MADKGNRRRGRGEGTIYRRSEDGLWIGQVTLSDGTRRTFYGKLRQDVAHKVTEALQVMDRGLPVGHNARLTVAAYLRRLARAREADDQTVYVAALQRAAGSCDTHA